MHLLIRYEDALNRNWEPKNEDSFVRLNSTLPIAHNEYQAPQPVMMSAVTPRNISTPIAITFSLPYQDSEIYAFFYFAELLELKIGESRQLRIHYNGHIWVDSLSPPYLQTQVAFITSPTVPSTDKKCQFVITAAEFSTHPPLLNALEVFLFKNLSEVDTNESDVMESIQM